MQEAICHNHNKEAEPLTGNMGQSREADICSPPFIRVSELVTCFTLAIHYSCPSYCKSSL